MRRRSLGQHYLTDGGVIGRMIELATIERRSRVLEIGTGKGVLTTELAKVAGRLEAYEVDRENYLATKNLVESGRVRLRLGDAFEAEPRFDVLVSSLPFSESSTFVEWLGRRKYERAVVILQEDFAEKITADPGDRRYRAISVIAQISAVLRTEDKVPRDAFEPQPLVNSRLVVFEHRKRLTLAIMAEIKRLFSLRRRSLGSALKQMGYRSPPAERLRERRVGSLTPDEVQSIIGSANPSLAAT